jgi:hypothetical protein
VCVDFVQKFLNLGAGFTQYRDVKERASFTPLTDVADLLEKSEGHGKPVASGAYVLEHAYKVSRLQV